MRVDDRANTQQVSTGPQVSTSNNVSQNQNVHRMSGNVPQQSQQYQQRMPRSGGPMQRGKFSSSFKLMLKLILFLYTN